MVIRKIWKITEYFLSDSLEKPFENVVELKPSRIWGLWPRIWSFSAEYFYQISMWSEAMSGYHGGDGDIETLVQHHKNTMTINPIYVLLCLPIQIAFFL